LQLQLFKGCWGYFKHCLPPVMIKLEFR
jgi:hypothetical protein